MYYGEEKYSSVSFQASINVTFQQCPLPVEVKRNSIMNKPPFTVSVEGNIGAGKSTMLKFFEQFTDVETVPEPVAKWRDLRGHNLLGNKFEDPQRSINDPLKCLMC